MANNALKVTEMTACSAPAVSDKLYVASNTAGNAVPRSVSVDILFSNTAGNTTLKANNLVISKNTTPANSTATVVSRSIWFDSDYLYVALSNNSIKRIALSSF